MPGRGSGVLSTCCQRVGSHSFLDHASKTFSTLVNASTSGKITTLFDRAAACNSGQRPTRNAIDASTMKSCSGRELGDVGGRACGERIRSAEGVGQRRHVGHIVCFGMFSANSCNSRIRGFASF
jgi:hypothetical protein